MAEKTDKDIRRLKTIVGKVNENTKIRLDQMINDFIMHPELKEVTFPNQLSNIERAYVHFQASRNGLQSVSKGYGSDRRLTLQRVVEKASVNSKVVALTTDSLTAICNLSALPMDTRVQRYPRGIVDNEIRQDSAITDAKRAHASRLCNGPFPKVPRPRRTNSFLEYRQRLPIWEHQDQIIDLLQKHPVIFIKGSTGCGKTTQVGQFILDHAIETSQKVRIICTVPRRIAAVTVSDRVAAERGERLGHAVGYQIRLESCVSPTETLLTYCTSGILLRSLTAPDYKILKNTTHIIIDEIHERDRQTDFLLTCLRDIRPQFPNLRLIIMGADMNDELFSSYFGGEQESPTINVEGRLHPVETYFLEDVLDMLHYENNDMRATKNEDTHTSVYNRMIEKLAGDAACLTVSKEKKGLQASKVQRDLLEVDLMIRRAWTTGDESAIIDFIQMVENQGLSVNYQHSEVGVTMLMAASVQGLVNVVSTLLTIGADIGIKSKSEDYEFSAIDWASDHRQHEVLKVLLEHQYQNKLMPALNDGTMDARKCQRLDRYLKSIDEERVDVMLVLRLLHQIHTTAHLSDAILVFLPGYDELVTLKHLLLNDTRLGFRHGTFRIFMLHSNIQSGDQRAAFDRPPKGMRKIVLSTNIAETSLTIEDIVYVVDSGRAKEKSYDSMTGVTQLRSVWVSKASVNQRRGRAGRCRNGICLHLFSSARYESMPEFPVPEIVRTSLQELCLQARSFMRPDVKIERFFTRLPEPPAPIAVKKAVDLLKVMGALDEDEQITKLGSHLLDFPVEPFLGKALIYSIVFRCLDPILTLVSIISYRDPFQLPNDPRDKQKAQECKIQFARGSFSDHMAYLKAFQDWEKSKMFSAGSENRFCRENYLSAVTFEMIYAIRMQLLGQLRACGFVKAKGTGDLKELNNNSNNWALVKGILVATLYPNICGTDRTKNVLYNSFNNKVSFHPSTTVAKKKDGVHDIPSDWIIFDEMTQQGPTNLVKGCTCVSTAAIALFAGSFTSADHGSDDKRNTNDNNPDEDHMLHSSVLKINQWIMLEGTKDTVDALLFLRGKIRTLILKRLEFPSTTFPPEEETIIQTVSTLLAHEDKTIGFKNIYKIGQWPKLVSGNLMAAPKNGYEKCADIRQSLGSGSDLVPSLKISNVRYFIVQVENCAHASDILRNGVWLVPNEIKQKIWNLREGKEILELDAVIYFWVPTANHFTGAIRVNAATELGFQSEVPVQTISTKVINLSVVEHEIGFKANRDLPMNGLELDSDLGAALLNMFQRSLPEAMLGMKL